MSNIFIFLYAFTWADWLFAAVLLTKKAYVPICCCYCPTWNKTKLKLWHFSFLHNVCWKTNHLISKTSIERCSITQLFLRFFKNLKKTNLSKFLEIITVNETSKSCYCSPLTLSNIEFFQKYFWKTGCILERLGIKNISEWLLFQLRQNTCTIDLHEKIQP